MYQNNFFKLLSPLLPGLLIAMSLTSSSLFAQTLRSCPDAKQRQVEDALAQGVHQLDTFKSKPDDKGAEEEIERTRITLAPLIESGALECARKDQKVMNLFVRVSGLICVLDPYEAGLEYILDLQKFSLYKKALSKIPPSEQKCLNKASKRIVRELKDGNS